MKLKTLIILTLAMASLSAQAIVSQRLTLMNGSTLDGYIQLQKPGEKIQFQADVYRIILTDKEVKKISDKEVNSNDLTEEWIQWADENNAWIGEGESRKLLLSNILTADGVTFSDVRVTALGSQIHFVGFTPRLFPLSWDKVKSVTCNRRKPTTLNGINRLYTLDDEQTFEGQYVHEVPGEAIAICDKTGMIRYFEAGKVVKYSLTKLNPDQNIYAQSDLIDVLVLKENNRTARGVIVERNYAQAKAADNYLLIQSENGFQEKILFSSISEYRKEPNKSYRPMEDILLKEGELCVNREKILPISLSEEDDLLVMESHPAGLIIAQEPKTTVAIVEFAQPDEDNVDLKIIKVGELPSAKKKGDVRFGFTYKDLAKSAISSKRAEVSVNKTCRQEFEITDPGYYVVYDSIHQLAYPFTIE